MNTDKSTSSYAITDGPIVKQLLLFFFPILLGTFFQSLYNTVDAVIVGRFVGKEALASVGGATSTVTNLMIGFFTGLCSGCGVAISQYYGARKNDSVDICLHTSMTFAMIVGAVLTVVGIIGAPYILSLMNTPDDVMAQAVPYLRIFCMGMIANLLYNMGAALIRALGDSKKPFYFLVVGCITNIILDLLFVAVFHWGVAGAAIATIISQIASAILTIISMMKPTFICRLQISKLHINTECLKRMIFIGLPAGFQSSMYNISNIILQSATNMLGTDTVAAWAAYGKIDSLFWMIMSSYGTAITTFVGQNYGAGRRDRIKKGVRITYIAAFATSILMSFVFYYGVGIVMKLFTTDNDVILIGTDLARYFAPILFTYVSIEILSGTLRGMADCWIPMILTIAGVGILRIVWISIMFPIKKDIYTIAFSYPLTWAVTSIAFIIYYLFFSKTAKAMRHS